VVLLGAGASVEFLSLGGAPLSSKSLSAALLDTVRWERIDKTLQEYLSTRPNAAVIRDMLDVEDALRLLHSCAEALRGTRFVDIGADEPGFEAVLHLLDRAATLLTAESPDEISHIDSLLPCVVNDVQEWGKWHARFSAPGKTQCDGWFRLPWVAREVITSAVIDAWTETDDNTKNLELHRKFYYDLGSKFASVGLYSLNYDPLILEAVGPLGYNTGFTQSGFEAAAFLAEDASSVAFLHGHVTFVPTGGNRYTLCREYHRLVQERLVRMVQKREYFSLGAKGVNYDRTLITGLDKFAPFVEAPYFAYLRRLTHDLAHADAVVIIGSSISTDDHLFALLTQLQGIEGKTIAFVDYIKPGHEETALAESPTGFQENIPSGRVMRLCARLGSKFSSIPHDDDWRRWAGELARVGICEMGRNFFYWSCGTSKFYEVGAAWLADLVARRS